ncbi:MAG: ATP-binding protein [Flavobacteriaceae bacterium]|nr:ATP-binding protein [Flavobacteriaceae bacterium]
MEIKKYILNSYTTVNPFSATILLEEKFLEKGYVVVIDDDNKFHGILTTCDLIKRPHKLVIDCLTEKEHLSADETITSGLDKFNSNQYPALPVFKENKFIGIVERQNVVDGLRIKINELYDKSIISQKVKQSFLNNLSHEVRTPLNGLLGFLELISELDIKDDETEKKALYNNIIRKSADRFLLVMNDLIDLALMNSNDDIKVKIEKINIENILSDLKEYFEIAVSDSNRDISVQYIIPDSSFVFRSDEKKIKQILYHLIDNAIKFSDDNNKVIFGYKIENQNIVFFVKNNCAQISKDKKKQIFEVFEKQDYHNDKLVEGLGIGLSLVKRLSELLNGKIELVTNETQTTFFCVIPLKR